MFSQCFLVNKSAFRYIVHFGNCMDPALTCEVPSHRLEPIFRYIAGNKLEGDWGGIVALGGSGVSLKKKINKFHLSLSDNYVNVEIN